MGPHDNRIGRIGRSTPPRWDAADRDAVSRQAGSRDQGREARGDGGAGAGAERDDAAADDRLELDARAGDVLTILRARVIAQTRGRLGVDAVAVAHQPHFVEAGPSSGVEIFVDRLLSAQNVIAGARHGDWPQPRIDRAVADALSAGVTETWELLEELGQLDSSAWSTLDAIAAELSRKWAGSS